eukprot:1159892-Pelagomonas_calceolata.AAC.28
MIAGRLEFQTFNSKQRILCLLGNPSRVEAPCIPSTRRKKVEAKVYAGPQPTWIEESLNWNVEQLALALRVRRKKKKGVHGIRSVTSSTMP